MSSITILKNGHLYTLDSAQPTATALAIQGGKLIAVGDDDTVLKLIGPDTETIDLNGRCVIPGLVDAHVHFRYYALALLRVNLDGAGTLSQALQRIESHLSGSPLIDKQWLRGHGWTKDQWLDGASPTAVHLDTLLPQNPVYLTHKSGHAAWVNSLALRLAGIDDHTQDPPGGQIERDSAGKATGVLLEEAMDLVRRIVPRPTTSQVVSAMRQAQQVCWQAGLTGIHDFDGPSCFRALQSLHSSGELGLRVIKNIPVAQLQNAVGVGLNSGFGDDWLRVGGIKIFADGALGPRTATMIAPYENEPDNYGIVVTDKEEMMEYASNASANGLSVTVHAIGDRANHDILDVYEEVRREEANRPHQPTLRHRIEHVQILHPQDINRLAQLNVIASMQPIHATSDMEMASRNWGDRARYSYAWRTVLDTGATLVFGSDAPVERIEPLLGIHAAVTRRRADGSPGAGGWYPEQRLTMHETIHGFTMAAAQTSGQEHQLGSITPGKFADLTIFDRDIFQMPGDELLEVNIDGTLVNGEFKHRTW